MEDAKSTGTVSKNTTQTIPTNDHPLVEKVKETSTEPPPPYNTVSIETKPSVQQAPPVTPVITVVQQQFGHFPVQCTCPNCHQTVVSRVEESNGLLTWLICILLVLVGCWLGCCLIPFCINDLQDKTHYCPQCGVVLGQKKII